MPRPVKGVVFAAIMAIGLFFAANASAVTITTTVPGSTNLYFSNWGHPYTVSGGGNEMYALGRGAGPVVAAYTFSSGQQLSITASGCVQDAGIACTDANGQAWLFRSLRVYSLIGVWSSTSGSITAVEGGVNPAFFIGTSASIIAPTYSGNLYLFMGENNGVFVDNHFGAYTVNINVANTTAVPEPSTLLLLGSGIFGIGGFGFVRRKFKV